MQMDLLKELEEKYQDLLSQANEDKLALENNSEELRKEEQIILSPKVSILYWLCFEVCCHFFLP